MELHAARFRDMPSRNPYTSRLRKFYDLYSINEDIKAKRAYRNKEGKSSRVVGGRSLWGGMLDVACSKYGWTLDYVLWGISYLNLNMMTSDAISVLTSFNEEDKPEVLNADDPANAAAILRQFGQLGE